MGISDAKDGTARQSGAESSPKAITFDRDSSKLENTDLGRSSCTTHFARLLELE